MKAQRTETCVTKLSGHHVPLNWPAAVVFFPCVRYPWYHQECSSLSPTEIEQYHVTQITKCQMVWHPSRTCIAKYAVIYRNGFLFLFWGFFVWYECTCIIKLCLVVSFVWFGQAFFVKKWRQSLVSSQMIL